MGQGTAWFGVSTFVAGLIVASAITGASDSDTEPKVEYITKESPPQIITRKEVEYRTEYVEVELPESCARLAGISDRLIDGANGFNNWSNKYYTLIEDVDLRVLEDPSAMTRLLQGLYKSKTKQADNLYGVMEATESAKDIQAACDRDIEAANDTE